MARSRFLRKFAKAILLPAAGLAALAYMGFPARVGLTASQAQVSMPGDLLLPTAAVQGDRAVVASGTPEEVWPLALELQSLYEDLFDSELAVVYRQAPDLVVWEAVMPARDDDHDQDLFRATVAVALRPVSGGTMIHVRERYAVLDGVRGRFAASVVLATSAVVTSAKLHGFRRQVAVGQAKNPLKD